MFDENEVPTSLVQVKDGPTSHHPFDSEAQEETASLPINPDLFCCVYGPCKHYDQIGVVERERAAGKIGDQKRVCRRFGDDEGEMDLTEANVDRCTSFQAPWWSWVGWKQTWIVATKLRATHQITAESGPATLRFRFRVAFLLGAVLHWPLPTLRYLTERLEDDE